MSLTSKDIMVTSSKSSARKITKLGSRSNSKSFGGASIPSASLPSPKYISASNYGGRKTIGVPNKK